MSDEAKDIYGTPVELVEEVLLPDGRWYSVSAFGFNEDYFFFDEIGAGHKTGRIITAPMASLLAFTERS